MKRTFAAAAVLAATAATAHAADQTPLEQMATKVALAMYGEHLDKHERTFELSSMNELPTPKACAAAAAAAAADTKVYTSRGDDFPTAKKDDFGSYVTPADVSDLCKAYEKAYVRAYVEAAITATWLSKSTMAQPVEGMYESEAQGVGKNGADCVKGVDAALAAGIPATEPISSKFYGMQPVALGEAKATVCQPAIDWATKRVADIKGAGQAKQDAIVAVYKKAGIKGKRLELYVSYGLPDDTGFFAAGCESYVTSLKALKSARKLFVWLEGNDGYTIRTFTFHGDDYTVTEHSYDTQAQAYRGCH